MLDVTPELAAQLVGCLATLRESIIPQVREAYQGQKDPRTLRKLEAAEAALIEALDRIFMGKPKLKYDVFQVVNRRVMVLDIGQVGTMQAFGDALRAYDKAKPPRGGAPARVKFEAELMALFGVRPATPEDPPDKTFEYEYGPGA